MTKSTIKTDAENLDVSSFKIRRFSRTEQLKWNALPNASNDSHKWQCEMNLNMQVPITIATGSQLLLEHMPVLTSHWQTVHDLVLCNDFTLCETINTYNNSRVIFYAFTANANEQTQHANNNDAQIKMCNSYTFTQYTF